MPQFIPSLLPNSDSAIDGARWRHRLALFRLLRKSVTALRPARFSTTAGSPAKFCSRTRLAAILSLPVSSGCAGWKLQTRTPITGHLHSRNAGGENDRAAGQLGLYSNEI